MEWEQTRYGGMRRTQVPQRNASPQETLLNSGAVATANEDGKAGSGSVRSEDHLNTVAVGRFESPLAYLGITIKLNEKLGLPDCPYLVRWRVETKWGSIRLHKWLSSDDPRNVHDHPWDFFTIVLRGGYEDVSPDGDEHLRAPAVRCRSALHKHTVFPDTDGAWTLVITGPKIRKWGFWVNGKFRKANKYFASYGHHPCD